MSIPFNCMCRTFSFVLMFLVLFFVFTDKINAATYYVTTSGSDTNPGTQSQPWKTISKAVGIMVPGDTVIILSGNYSSGIVYLTKSGTYGSPITYQTQGTVIVKGFNIQADYITIKGFEITSGFQNTGMFITGAYNLIENNYIHDTGRYGLVLYGPLANQGNLRTHDNIIRNNKLYHNRTVGLYVEGRNNLIENNEIWENVECIPPSGTTCDDDADGIWFFGQGHVIRKNYIHNNLYGTVGINPSTNDFIDNAHIDCFQTWAGEADVGANILFEQNYCDNLQFQNDYEKGQGWMLQDGAHDLIIRNNIIRAYRGINNNGGNGTQANHLYIYNNTFINDLSFPAQPNVAELRNAVYSVIKNNIFYNQKNSTIYMYGDTTGLVVDYNLVYNTDGSLPIFMNYPVQHELRRIDPQFVNPVTKDYHLKPTSPAINAGIAISDMTNDYDGITRPQGGLWDIGAYEYGGIPSSPFPTATHPPITPGNTTATRTPTRTRTPTPTPGVGFPGDLNGDSHVDIFDYNILVQNFGRTGSPGFTPADIDRSGTVDIFDYNILVGNFGR